MLLEVPRPVTLNLIVRHSLPFAHIRFAKPYIRGHEANSQSIRDDGGGHVGTTKVAGDDGIEHAKFLACTARLLVPKVRQLNVGLALPTTHGIPFALAVPEHEDASGGCHPNSLGGASSIDLR
ncbi:unannotated protein [freshwater metagenome]|uniref:Unannotated protein n=1 Tax=freshwater metagenome TaxID=449393 RepID=A0A6J6HSM6_9ZZZZ